MGHRAAEGPAGSRSWKAGGRPDPGSPVPRILHVDLPLPSCPASALLLVGIFLSPVWSGPGFQGGADGCRAPCSLLCARATGPSPQSLSWRPASLALTAVGNSEAGLRPQTRTPLGLPRTVQAGWPAGPRQALRRVSPRGLLSGSGATGPSGQQCRREAVRSAVAAEWSGPGCRPAGRGRRGAWVPAGCGGPRPPAWPGAARSRASAGWSRVEPAGLSRLERGGRRGGRAHTRWTCLSCSAGTRPAAGRWQPLARHPSGRAAGRFSVFPRRLRAASAFRGVQPSDARRPEGSLLAAGVRRGRRARVPESTPRPHARLLRGRHSAMAGRLLRELRLFGVHAVCGAAS